MRIGEVKTDLFLGATPHGCVCRMPNHHHGARRRHNRFAPAVRRFNALAGLWEAKGMMEKAECPETLPPCALATAAPRWA
jgi:hypothetical protein